MELCKKPIHAATSTVCANDKENCMLHSFPPNGFRKTKDGILENCYDDPRDAPAGLHCVTCDKFMLVGCCIPCRNRFRDKALKQSSDSRLAGEPDECGCACHENKLNKPYLHDTECCKDMNGIVPTILPSGLKVSHGPDGWERKFVSLVYNERYSTWRTPLDIENVLEFVRSLLAQERERVRKSVEAIAHWPEPQQPSSTPGPLFDDGLLMQYGHDKKRHEDEIKRVLEDL